MENQVSLHALVYGHVQGVYFRAFVAEKATGLGLTGYVRNLNNTEAVEIRAEGPRADLDKLVAQTKIGPPGSRVDRVTADWGDYTGKFPDFHIRYF